MSVKHELLGLMRTAEGEHKHDKSFDGNCMRFILVDRATESKLALLEVDDVGSVLFNKLIKDGIRSALPKFFGYSCVWDSPKTLVGFFHKEVNQNFPDEKTVMNRLILEAQ